MQASLHASNIRASSYNDRWQTLVEAERNTYYKSILSSTQKLFFFGTPFHGLRTEELEAVVDTESNGQRHNLLIEMREDSEFLDNQEDDLIRIWADFKGKIVTFFETVPTPSIRKVINISGL